MILPGKNIYEQQKSNRRKTIAIMTLFVLFVGFLGFGFDAFYLGTIREGIFLPIGTGIALIIGFVSAFHSLKNGAKGILKSCNAFPAIQTESQYKQLINVVAEMSIAAGLQQPVVYVIPDEDPNAFATGKDAQNGAIAVTAGLLKALSRDELQGVVAHEMSHIRNDDMRLMTVIAALVGSVLLLSEWVRRSFWRSGGVQRASGRSRKGGGVLPILMIVWLVSIILAPILARLMAMAVSRNREYLADASAAELTRNPMALASALKKINSAVEPTRSIKKGVAHLCIADPLESSFNSKEGFFAELFGTHPPVSRRITALKAMAFQQGATPAEV